MNSVFAVESYACIANEAAPLACAHWRESEAALYGRQHAVPITAASYRALEAAGALHLVTVRTEGRLAGYLAFCVSENPVMPGTRTAVAMALYLEPALREDPFLALRLLRWGEASLRQRGVSGVGYSSPASRPCDALYRRLGARMTETLWYKEI